MTIQNRIRPKIAHFGAFDHDSYGDLIFPFIVEHYLPEFEFVHVSPSGKSTPWSDAKKTISVCEAFKIDDWDGVLVGGGDIVQVAEGFIWNDSAIQSLGALNSLWCGASLLSAKLDIPCAWNSPGVPAGLPDPTLSMAQDGIQFVDYLAVRDELSAERVKRLVNHPLNVVPDTALAIGEIWKRSSVKDNANKPLILSLTPMDIEQRAGEIEFLIRSVAKGNGFSGEVVILPLMGWQKSGLLHKIEKLKDEFNIVIKDRSLTLQDCALEISKGRAYVGNSLHGLITALSYGIPAVHVKPVGFGSVTKYQGFARHFPDGEQLLAENFIEASKIISSGHNIKIDKSVQLIKEHFCRVKNALGEKGCSKKIKWENIIKACDIEARDLLMHGYTAHQLLNDRSEKLNIRDGQIASLNQVVAERDGQIASLNQAAAERDGQIASLNQAVVERDVQIASLNQAVAERDVQIANLRDDADRIVSGKDAEIHGVQQQLNHVLSSRSCRLTAPLRKAAMLVRQGARSHRMPFLRRIAKRLRIRSDVFPRFAVRQIREVFSPAIDAEVEAIRKSGLFDEAFYLSMYSDLQPAPHDPIRHYCEYGWREGMNPSDDFDTSFYLATYSDIRNAGINPFWHYVVAGSSEMRHALPDSATRYENDIWFGVVDTDIKLLAFYASPDWATVRSGRPMFKGHSQQPLPHEELGFYDPSDWRVLKHQAGLAKRHGLYGFCFDLGDGTAGSGPAQVLESFLDHDDIDFRFCVQTELSSEDVLAPRVASLLRAVSDRRYIRIADRPVVLFTMPAERQGGASLLGQLRRRLADQGVGRPFLIGRWASAGEGASGESLADLCDAVLDLPSTPVPGETGDFVPLQKNGVDIVPYGVVASQGIARARRASDFAYPLYHAVTLGRDNTAQRPVRPLVYKRFHVRDYRRWLDAAIAGARAAHPDDRRFVFVNAWNDWNEGLFLEPERKGGFCRVNETTRALLGIASGEAMPKVSVIVPNYNHEPFLRRRLNSIYGQTYKNIEVILLDDCSSDQSRSLLDEYAAAHPEITSTLYNEENSGSAFRQWAKGIKAATGDLVWIAESDDFCDERFLEVLVRCFDDEAVLLAYAKSSFVDKNEVPIRDDFKSYLSDLECAEKWNGSYVETAHNEVRSALGIKNTIPNASGVVFKRPVDMSLLDDESWLSMRVAGDWVFYLQIIRGGKIAYSTETENFFRRYEGSTAEVTYRKEVFYREVGMASRTAAALYDVPLAVLEQSRRTYRIVYENKVGRSDEEFALWYDYPSVLEARERRLPNVMVSTMGFFPGGAEILPIRLANEFKRQGLSVLLLNAGLNPREDGVRRMLRNDVPVIETSSVEDVKSIIHDFGVEVLNTHQWHIQKYPLQVPDVFDELRGHVASLHGMIEHGDAFGVTEEQLRKADQAVTTWVYTAEKNIVPFTSVGLYDKSSSRFVKMPNGMQPPHVVPVPRADMGIPEDAFALCCVSRAIPDKGWAETILVVERARALSGRDIRLILVGNGPVYDEYCRSGVPDFVYLAGFSENSVGYYAAADMGIMLTKFKSESFPLTIVDCLFAGKPYIASDVGDIRNMLTTSDDVAGEVIELEDWEVPIERAAQVVAAFATDQQKYVNALALVQDVAHRYKIDVVASQYVRLFESSRDEPRLRSGGRSN